MSNIKFTEFPSATVVGSMDIIPIVQSGINKKTTAAIFQTYLSSNFVPYTGATTNLNLDAFDLYTAKVWLKDVPNDTFGSLELTDGVLHFEDGDGHSMVTMEDGYLTIANASTIRALLDVSALSANRDFAFPNASGTLALTSQIPSVSGTTNYLPKFTGASALGNSALQETTNALGFAVTPSAWVGAKAISVGNAGSYYADGLTYGWNTGIIANAYRIGADSWKYQNSGVQATRIEMNETYPFAIHTAPVGTAGNAVTFTQAMTITSAGNVGIGTTSPDSTLTINGTGSSQIRLRSNDGNRGFLYVDGGEFALGTSTSIPLNLQINGATRLSIATTGAATFSSSVSMVGNGKITSITPYLELRDTNWAASTFVQTGVNVGATASGDYFNIYNPAGKGLSYVRNGVVDFMINSAGFVGIGTTTPNRALTIVGGFSEQIALTSTTTKCGIALNPSDTTFSPYIGATGNSVIIETSGNERMRIATDGVATFTNRVNIGNPVAAAVAVASTHKVTISIGGVTYYLLATNV
jgi:hypothetical protein